MFDSQSGVRNDGSEPLPSADVEGRLDERFDIEALCQIVEHLDFSSKLSEKLTESFRSVRGQVGLQSRVVGAVQQEIRALTMDVALIKRALVSLGHTGVMERRRIERELIRELFPPATPRPGAGVFVNNSRPGRMKTVDCDGRLHLCKAACCRIFNVHLTPAEVDQDVYEWDPRQPYSLQKNRVGCQYLRAGSCACSIYESRPTTCGNYSCENDKRIWQDFDKMILNPELAKRLETLHVTTGGGGEDGSMSRKHAEELRKTEGVSPDVSSVRDGAPVDSAVSDLPTQSRPKVAPPDFSELRELMVPRPAKPFVPPDKGLASTDRGSDSAPAGM